MKRTQLNRVSKKQKARLTEYGKLRKDYLKYHPNCEVRGCSTRATDIHHMEGRGSKTNDTSTWLATCRSCHEKIHSHPSWARENGYLV